MARIGCTGIPIETLDTPLGQVDVYCASPNLISVTEGRQGAAHITVNRVDYTFRLTLERKGGQWQLEADRHGNNRRAVIGTRVQYTGNWSTMDLTGAARKKVEAVIVPLVAAWADDPANRLLLLQGEVARLKEQRARQTREIDDLQAKVTVLRDSRYDTDKAIALCEQELGGQQALEVAA